MSQAVPAQPLLPLDENLGETLPAHALELAWEPAVDGQRRVAAGWREYLATAQRLLARFEGALRVAHFDYEHPVHLQPGTAPRLRRPYHVPVAYTEWGRADAPLLLCCGGVANVAMRFNYLANDLADEFRIICVDWLGRGRSGWLAAERDYSLATYAEQLRQLIKHLGGQAVTLLGSSLGGSAAIELISQHPALVQRLILNDVGPFIPVQRRRRRADTLARHYVFRDPADLLRRVGISQKNDGPVSEALRFILSFHQTRWSAEDGGRVYRHDVRAMQAYQRDAQQSLHQWPAWQHVRCPVLLIHGLESDALSATTIKRMARTHDLSLLHLPDTGHAPLLADRNQIWFVRQWLLRSGTLEGPASVLHAPARERYGSER